MLNVTFHCKYNYNVINTCQMVNVRSVAHLGPLGKSAGIWVLWGRVRIWVLWGRARAFGPFGEERAFGSFGEEHRPLLLFGA
jgi:hypothetical protein